MSTTRTFEEIGSVGTFAVDQRPRHYSASIPLQESRGKRSLGKSRSQVFQTSQERIHEQHESRDRQAIESASESILGVTVSDLGLGRASVSLPASPLMYNDNTYEDAFWDSSQAPARKALSKKPSRLLRYDAAPDEVHTTPRGIGGGMVIPMRDSSIRHRHVKNPTHRKRRSYPPGEKMSPTRAKSNKEEESALDTRPEKVVKLPEVEVDEVTKRIKELKELKKRRDLSPETDTTESRRAADSPLSEVKSRPTSIARSPSRNPTASGESQAAQADDFEPPDAAPEETTTPSPSVVQRHDRDSWSHITSATRRIGTIKVPDSPTATTQEAQPTPLQRSNSRLRRMVRPIGGTGVEENKRAFSKRFSQPMRVLEVEERPTSADSIDDAVEEYLSSPRLTQRIHHPQTERVISFSDVGDPTGSVVFCCVGMGLTRYITAFYDELAASLRLRLITPDRPGVGESEVYADGSDTPLSWPGKMKPVLFPCLDTDPMH